MTGTRYAPARCWCALLVRALPRCLHAFPSDGGAQQDDARRFLMVKAPHTTSAARPARRVARRPQLRPPLSPHVQKREKQLAPTIAKAARQARNRAGLTQEEVADGAGVATEVYGRMERGLLLPSVPTLLRLCLTLQSTPDALMGFSPLPPPQHAPEPSPVPPGLVDTPDTRRLLRLLGRLQGLQLKLILRLVIALVAER